MFDYKLEDEINKLLPPQVAFGLSVYHSNRKLHLELMASPLCWTISNETSSNSLQVRDLNCTKYF